MLTQVDLALINTNYALEAKLDPTKDALVIEGSDSPYVNILVTREDNKDSDAMKKLVAALHTPGSESVHRSRSTKARWCRRSDLPDLQYTRDQTMWERACPR